MNKKLLKEIFLFLVLGVILTASIFEISFLNHLIFTHPYISAFVAGFFIVSIFTAVPATAVMATLSFQNSILPIAVLGSIGATLGNFYMLSLFESFVITYISKSIKKYIRKDGTVIKFIGVLIWVLPIPDEIPMAILGISKTKNSSILVLSLIINFLTVLNIALIAKGLR